MLYSPCSLAAASSGSAFADTATLSSSANWGHDEPCHNGKVKSVAFSASRTGSSQGYPNLLPRFPAEPGTWPIRILAPPPQEASSRERASKNPIASICASHCRVDPGGTCGRVCAHRAPCARAGVATVRSTFGVPAHAHLHAWPTRPSSPRTFRRLIPYCDFPLGSPLAAGSRRLREIGRRRTNVNVHAVFQDLQCGVGVVGIVKQIEVGFRDDAVPRQRLQVEDLPPIG